MQISSNLRAKVGLEPWAIVFPKAGASTADYPALAAVLGPLRRKYVRVI